MALLAWRLSPGSLRVMYVSSFLMNLGFYALIPYLTLHLTGTFFWSLALTGVLMAVRQLSQQGLTFIGGAIADRFGTKETLVFGVGVRAVGFLSFAFCSEVWHFFTAAIVAGVGGALFEPAYQAMFTRLTPAEHRKILFSFKNIVANIGMVFSTIVGSVLSNFDFFYLSIVSGMLYVLIGALIWWKLPHLDVELGGSGMLADMQTIIRDKPFVNYTLILIGYYYLFMQLFLTVPQLAEQVMGKSGVAVVYGVVALSVILFQLPLTKRLQVFPDRFSLINLGTTVMGVGLFLYGFSDHLLMLLLSSVVFSFGTMIAGPLLMDVIPVFASPRQIGSYFGFNGYALAVGGALSTVAGGWLYDLGMAWNVPGLPWYMCLAIALAAAVALRALKDDRGRFERTGLRRLKQTNE